MPRAVALESASRRLFFLDGRLPVPYAGSSGITIYNEYIPKVSFRCIRVLRTSVALPDVPLRAKG
eukprot:6470411-Amphidinium_carterae.1